MNAVLETGVRDALSARRPKLQEVEELIIAFSPPAAGWIGFHLVTPIESVVQWELSNTIDPFRTDVNDTIDISVKRTFISWLEAVASGANSALVVDMEGPLGILAVVADADLNRVELVVYSTSGGVLLNGRLSRKALLDQFYNALLAYWEGPMLAASWREWASKEIAAPWPIRSSAIEDWLANA